MARSVTEARAARKARRIAVAIGAVVALYGFTLMHRGVLTYANGSGQTLFAPATLLTGLLIFLVGIVPESWVAFFIPRERSRKSRARR